MEFKNYLFKKTLNIRNYRLLLCICILATFAGCSSSGEIKINKPLTKTIDHHAVVSLSVAPAGDIDPNDETVKEVSQRLKGELFGRLVSEGVFKQVVHAGEEAKYMLNIWLVDAKEVSQGARIFFGVLAGSNSLAITGELMDSEIGKSSILDFVVTGESASHPFSSENDMDDAIREVVDEIILALL